jgi:hypothetical protein
MLSFPLVSDTDVNRAVQPGDILAGGERLTPIANAAGITITGNNLLGGIINRTLNAAVTDTFDTSSNIINQLLATTYRASGANTPRGIQQGTTFRAIYINNGSGVVTFAAGAGVTLVQMGTLAVASVREMLITLLNTNEPSIVAATITNLSAVVTGMNQAATSRVSPGMLVTGTGVPAATTVLSVQPGIGVTLSAAATASNTLNALTFSPAISITGLGTYAL